MADRLTNRASVGGYRISYGYTPAGLRTNMTDPSGVTSYAYDNLNRMESKTVAWSGGPTVSLNYRHDRTGAVTNIWSSTANGVNLIYQHDPLGRITNVLANGTAAAAYAFDKVGNLESVRYGNGVTNLYQYDTRNRLTNALWKLSGTTRASFAYRLGPTGLRTRSTESLNGAEMTYDWTYDRLDRLTRETLAGATNATLAYAHDPVGNRTERTSTLSLLPNQAFDYTGNDRITSAGYDNNGNTTDWGAYAYDPLDHLTSAMDGEVLFSYDGDGNRVKKRVGGRSTYYLEIGNQQHGECHPFAKQCRSGFLEFAALPLRQVRHLLYSSERLNTRAFAAPEWLRPRRRATHIQCLSPSTSAKPC